jgi:pheromone shutdown protein TraB
LARKLGKNVIFADRSAEVSLERIFYLRGLKHKIYSIINLPMLPVDLLKIDVKFNEMIEATQKNLFLFPDPIMQMIMIFERDFYFIHHLRNSPGKDIIGIFGLGHIRGILEYWDRVTDDDIPMLESRSRGFDRFAQLWLDKNLPLNNNINK